MSLSERLYHEMMDKFVRKNRANSRGEQGNKSPSRGVSTYNTTTQKPYELHVNLANPGGYGGKPGLYNAFASVKATLAPKKPYLKQKMDYIRGTPDRYFSPAHSYA